VPALLRLRDAGFQLVLFGVRDRRDEALHDLLVQVLASQGIAFAAVRVCGHCAAARCECRPPRTGLFAAELRSADWSRADSFAIGTDKKCLLLAENLGVRGAVCDRRKGWLEVAHDIADAPRRARVERVTKETTIAVGVDLDAAGPVRVRTGIGFFDHMLEQIARNAGIALAVACKGDLQVDEHHTVEDVAIALGSAIQRALGDRRGIGRYGFVLPMDEAEAHVAVDLSGRAAFVFEAVFPRAAVGELPTELVSHFFRSLGDALGAAVHMKVTGENTHHMIEALFKGFGRALRPALRRGDGSDVPSTKGILCSP
jgi:imidazoleglycerol-phosphate dehydratase/histidinol-phosphatase